MNQDEARDILRRINALERERGHATVREGNLTTPSMLRSGALELIDALGAGPIAGIGNVDNVFGYPVWKGSSVVVWVDYASPVMMITNAAKIIQAEYVSGTATLLASFTDYKAAVGGHFDGEDVDDTLFEIADPGSLLTGITAGDLVLFEAGAGTTKPNKLTVVEFEAIGSGDGGGGSWPGWPGPTPPSGTSPAAISVATVDNAAGVSSAGAVAFDNGAAIIGAAIASGSAANDFEQPFWDNELFAVLGKTAGGNSALKIGVNIFLARVNKSGSVLETDTTFGYDSAQRIVGGTPPTTGTCQNVHACEYADDQWIVCIQPRDNGNIVPITRGCPFHLLKGVPSATVNGSSSATFSVTSPTLVSGLAPVGGITVNNASPATVRATTSETMIYMYDRTAGSTIATRWRPSTAWNHWQRKKAIADYDAGFIQVEGHDASGNEVWLYTTLCNVDTP